MFNRDKATHPARASRLAATAVWIGLLMPFAAVAGLSTTASRDEPAPSTETKPEAGSYQIRCWQEGRLLFEQNRVRLSGADGARYGIKISGTDRNQRPIYVADTKNATCLIRAAVEERAWSR